MPATVTGRPAAMSDWRATFRLSQRLRDVTPDDVRRVAERYFRAENRTVATLVRPEAAR